MMNLQVLKRNGSYGEHIERSKNYVLLKFYQTYKIKRKINQYKYAKNTQIISKITNNRNIQLYKLIYVKYIHL
ncbi:hypothetical protein COY16_04375 [Candidatus Roizmanbacteria bacterium CG_4_10_14_0_2_um_filter_39_13]|uniref:Uncharacterized protein n=1 Tax=Candidatus Roizmanbacteria bacterium CG_4_10_14_0_2_um_filter_39_13 TaxID=1974825 RepID=A0A2M7TXU4_9BACT|nr:MAG: hypothetical protein COY16_04375 [Candidatus Roizmanbacteria bacterium CG_4_10_14_0_2_um_filter_39_13]